eukprot:Hpha_TRINITY_DN16193_c1_g5::TRINITY_DN16193_c1_g5_i1::g.3668::m.3668/K00939/adk, AK; adenylate kinase
MMSGGGGLAAGANEYLEKHNIPALFEHLFHELVLNQPEKPLEFLAESLETPPVHQVVVCGPPGAGKGTQSKALADKLGLINVCSGELLRDEVRQGTKRGKEVTAALEKGELVPDDLVTDLVIAKLKSEDLRGKGWVLDGFPRTRNQAHALQSSAVIPHLFVVLDVPDDVLLERMASRKVDPQTRTPYNMLIAPPTDPEILDRLEQRADDVDPVASRRKLAAFHRNRDEMLSSYTRVLRRVDGNRAMADVTAEIEAAIKAALPQV